MLPGASSARPWKRILVVVTEDWFVLSHFVPLLTELKTLAAGVVVATRSSGRLDDIRSLGVEVRELDLRRGSLKPHDIKAAREDLVRLIDGEGPDAIHAIAMQPMVMVSLALARSYHQPAAVMLHLTGRGYLGYARTPLARLLRALAQRVLRRCAAHHATWLMAENEDDLAEMVAARIAAPGRTAILPGAGVDPARYPQMPPPNNAVPQIAFVGRMLRSKGLHVLIDAYRLLRARGVAAKLALYGDADLGNREAIPEGTLVRWNEEPGVTWNGRTGNVVEVWRTADIAVVPPIGGDGMPRAMLEAAACGRPLVVTDVPGCRQFVRGGVEGLVVPPGDARALADALATLIADRELRLQAGAAARRKLVREYTEAAVRARTREAYLAAAGAAGVKASGV
ncbi:MAG TPA: glycosyltransferase [Hyphomicrobiaceae bacterium]|nr:glycosyltransferase [Hyphomicrobiaceae bacterium]